MSVLRRLGVTATLCAVILACGAPPGRPELLISTSLSAFDGRTQRPQIRVRALKANGDPGDGKVDFVSPTGTFLEGSSVDLVDGSASVTFRCDPSETAACSGAIRIGANWGGIGTSIVVEVDHAAPPTTLRWKVVPTNTLSQLKDTAVAADGQVWAVGTRGAVLRFDGSTWTPVPTPVTVDFAGVWAGAQGEVVAVGQGTTLVQWRAGSAELVTGDGLDDFTGVWGTDLAHLYLTTSKGRVGTFNGRDFAFVTIGAAPLRTVAGRQSDGGVEVWAAGDEKLVRQSGATWVEQASPVLARWRAARWAPDGLWLAGTRIDAQPTGQGIILVGPDPAWRSTVLGTEQLNDLFWPEGSEEHFAVTDTTVYRKIGSAPWESLETPMGGASIAGRSEASIVIVGPPGLSLVRVQ